MNIKGMAFLCAFTVSAAFAEEDVVDTTDGLTINVDEGQEVTRAEKFTGSGKITKTGTGKLIFSNPDNDFTGGITVSAGQIQADAVGAFGTGLIYTSAHQDNLIDMILNAEGTYPNSFTRSGQHGKLVTVNKTATIEGTLMATGSCSIQSGGITVAAGATATFKGSATGCKTKYFYVTGGGTAVFDGKMVMRPDNSDVNVYLPDTMGARVVFNNPENAFGVIRMRAATLICGADNVLNNAYFVFDYGKGYAGSRLDLNGHDQSVRSFNFGQRDNVSATVDAEVVTNSSDRLTKLTVACPSVTTNYCQHWFRGNVALTVDANPAYKLVVEKRANTMTGPIEVKSGCLQLGSVATSEDVGYTTKGFATSFPNVTEVKVGANGRLELANNAAASVFPSGQLSLTVEEGGKVKLPASLTLTLAAFRVGETDYRFGTYSSANCPAIESGTIVIPPRAVVEAGWTAAGESASVSDAANWDASGAFDLDKDRLAGTFRAAGSQALVDADIDFTGLVLDRVGGFTFTGEKTMSVGADGIVAAAVPETEEGRTYAFEAPIAFNADQTWTVPADNTLAFSNMDSPYTMLVKKTGGGAVTLSGTNVIDGHVRLSEGNVRLSGLITTSAGVDTASANSADSDRHTFYVDVEKSGVATVAGVEVDKPFTFGGVNGTTGFFVEAGTTNVFNGHFASRNASGQKLYLYADSAIVFNGGFRQDWGLTFEGLGTIYLRNKPYVRGGSMSDSVARERGYYFLLSSPKSSNGRLTAVVESTGNKTDFAIPDGTYGGTFDFRVSEAAASGYWLIVGSRDDGSAAYVKLNATTQTFAKVTATRKKNPCTISGSDGAALRVNGAAGADSVISADIVGDVAILKEGAGTLTLKPNGTTQGAFASTGAIVVSGGTLAFAETASWLNGTNVTVCGTGTLSLPTSRVFARRATLDLADDGVVSIPDGASLRVHEAFVDGQPLEVGTYTRATAPAALQKHLTDTTGCLCVTGEGAILIVR